MFSKKYLTAALAAILCVSHPAVFAAQNDSQSLYLQAVKVQSGDGTIDLSAAQGLLEKAAAAGSGMAMHRLGDMYHDGDGGVKKDFAKALEWYKKEADLDAAHPGAGAWGMVAVARCYERGEGVTRDQSAADEWYKKAVTSGQIGAGKGDNSAMIALAVCQAQGKGTKADPVGAWNWAIKSSSTPNAACYELMASLYDGGIGVTRDPEKAAECLLSAAQMGVSEDMLEISLCFARGDGVNQDGAAAQEWIKKAIDRGNGHAMGILGTYYHSAVGVDRNETLAHDWYQKAIDSGDERSLGFMGDSYVLAGAKPHSAPTAQSWYEKGVAVGDVYSMYQLAMLLTKDPDITHDVPHAEKLLRQSADLGYADSMNAIGELYRAKLLRGTDQDAMKWFQMAADNGNAAGMRNIGEILRDQGLGDRVKDYDDNPELFAQGFNWIKKAAEAGDPEAMADMGEIFQLGLGTADVSNPQAVAWYKKSAALGNVRSMRNLGMMYMAPKGIGTDYDQAIYWLQGAVAANDGPAMAALGEMYEKSMIDQNPATPGSNLVKARQLYQQAIDLDTGAGFRGMGRLYRDGLGVDKKADLAARYFQSGVDHNDGKSMEALGRMYELGQGVPKNLDTAKGLFKDAYVRFGEFSARDWLVSHDVNTVQLLSPPATAPATAPRN